MSETVELTSTNSHVLAPSSSGQDLVTLLSRKVVGQSTATNIIVPYVYMYQSGLAPTGRPAGVFLLLGPTGTGKTRTVEAIADLLHGSEKQLVKIDCGEFQLEHETAKLIGAPPGYLGHRETVPMLTQQGLKDANSDVPVLFKAFLATEVLNLIRGRVFHTRAAMN